MLESTAKGFCPRNCIRKLIVYLLIDSYIDLTICNRHRYMQVIRETHS